MMRQACLIWICLALTACTSSPVKITTINREKESAAIKKVMDDQAKAWNQGSIDGFMNGYWHSDSLQFITARGIRKGYDSVSNNYKKHYDSRDKMGILTFSKLILSPLSDDHTSYHVTGNWEVKQKDQLMSGFFSLIFRKIDSEWKIVIDHTW